MYPKVIQKLMGVRLRIENLNSWLDIGTGDGNTACSYPYFAKIPKKIGIDPQRPLKLFHGPEWKLLKEEYKEGCSVWNEEFQLVTMFDFIEHLEKDVGLKVLDHLEKTTFLIIIFTPKGHYPQEGNEWDRHKCGWEMNDFLERGYSVKLLKEFYEKGDALFAWKYKEG